MTFTQKKSTLESDVKIKLKEVINLDEKENGMEYRKFNIISNKGVSQWSDTPLCNNDLRGNEIIDTRPKKRRGRLLRKIFHQR